MSREFPAQPPEFLNKGDFMQTEQLTNLICNAIYNKKGTDIVVLDVSHLTSVAERFIIASGRSAAQVKALCDEVGKKTKEAEVAVLREEGYREGRWIAMDFGFIVVHLFNAETREFYHLEKLWTDGANQIPFEPEKTPAKTVVRKRKSAKAE